MYKRFSLQELKTVQNNFIPNFFWILKKEGCIYPSDFFKKIFKDGEGIYYFNRWEATFRIAKQQNSILIIDEKEKIEILLDEEGKREIQSIIKTYITKKEKVQGQKSIEQIVLEEFQKGAYGNIAGKPYLVYDIETTANTNNLKETKFLLAYAMEPKADNTMEYEYIASDDLAKFVQKMIDFDGYIIGFNNIAFDNPVCVYNVWWSAEDVEKINKKSLDLFLFVQGLTGKRIGLNKIATALIGVSKTLESGTEVETLMRKYKETWDLKLIEEAKKYCKNDVRMTALVLLYFLHYQKLFIEGEAVTFNVDDLIEKWSQEIKEVTNNKWGQTNIFA